MFQSIQIDQLHDPNIPTDHPAYWLAQLRRVDWQCLLNFIDMKLPMKTKKQTLAETALPHFELATCEGRGEVWQIWTELRHESCRSLVIQFRHSEIDWSRGTAEFVDLEQNEPLGLVNIAARLICKVK